MLQISLNSDLIINKKLIKIDIVFHFDAVGHETMVQFKGLAPRGVRLFERYGCTQAVVVCGWAGKENNFNKLGGDVLEKVLEAIAEPFRIPQLPNTLFLLKWKYVTGILEVIHFLVKIFLVFKLADRAAMGFFFGWKMQASTFSSGITIERRETWTDGLYVKDKEKRFWTVGANLKRWMGREDWGFLKFSN